MGSKARQLMAEMIRGMLLGNAAIITDALTDESLGSPAVSVGLALEEAKHQASQSALSKAMALLSDYTEISDPKELLMQLSTALRKLYDDDEKKMEHVRELLRERPPTNNPTQE